MMIKKPKFWSSINFFSIILLPFTFLYFLLFSLKKNLVSKQEFSIPIICVGNIFIGGTGKTPLSIYIYNFLKKKKFKPAITRKYYKSHFDEIDLTKKRVGRFFQNKNRITAVEEAQKNGSNVVIMDDGFQDFSIKKDLNIICFNNIDTVGNGLMLPAGPLREPLKNINEAQIVIINGKRNKNFENKIKSLSRNTEVFYSQYIIRKKSNFINKKFLAFAGIGNPESFFNLLKENKFNIKQKISFPDHYSYTKNDMKNIDLEAKKKNLKLITTEKDFHRIKLLGLKKIDYISVDLKILKHKSFEQEILKYL